MPKKDRRQGRPLTFTYRDNPYSRGTPEHDIWYTAFVHGLNSASRDFLPLTDKLTALLVDAVSKGKP